ncbi:MAG: type IX secretion system membrane protein PorP/SprF [Flavobacteriales bacterium]|nr:type IX secretion system membrane protein PorP/SprF [Flavobacteriales bacterium]
MKKLLSILVLGCVVVTASSQQQYQISQYQTNPYMLNPAASGIYDYLDVTASFRQQWAGFTNAPRTFYVSGHSALKFNGQPKYNPSLRSGRLNAIQTPEVSTGKLKHSVGGYIMGDEYGAFNQLNVTASYAVHIPIVKGYNVSAGIAMGYSQYTFDQTKVDMLNDVDPTYTNFLSSGMNQGYFNMNAGIQLYSEHLRVGYTSSELLRTLVKFGGDKTNFDLRVHHYITAEFKIPVNEKLSVTPSAVVKFMKPAPVSIDGTVLVTYDRMIWGGVSFRNGDALIGLVGLNLSEKFKLGYSYDFTISKLRTYNKGGHEIVLGLMLGKK